MSAPMTRPGLRTVWLYGRELAELERLRGGRLRLRFTTAAVERYGLSSRPLSLSLPVTDRRVSSPVLDRYLDNLLPESVLRGAIERQHRVHPGDTFGLLSAIGHECAGAVQFTPAGEPPDAGRLRPLSTVEVDAIVRDLPTLASPDGLPISASLGGVQEKVLLTRTHDGWAWPAGGAISTHIVKPEPVTGIVLDHLSWLEEWTLRLAERAGLAAARAHLEEFGGRVAIVVERYDRVGRRRTHQEDFAQALGVAAVEKYEPAAQGPGRLRRIAHTAAALASDAAALRRDLLRAVTFHAVIGDGDAHSKNYSLLISEDGYYSLSPVYDAAPVFLANPRYFHFGHSVNGRTDLRYISAADLVAEAASWGLAAAEASDIVAAMAAAVAKAAETTAADDRIARVARAVEVRAARFA